MDFVCSIVKLHKPSNFKQIFFSRIHDVINVFSYVLRLTSNYTERFLTFPDSSCQEKCTQLFKTCNVRMALQCKIIQLFKIVAFLFTLVYFNIY